MKNIKQYIRGKRTGEDQCDPLRNSTQRVVCDESEMAGLLNGYLASTITQEQGRRIASS